MISNLMRILADLPEADVRKLDELAAQGKRSRAAEIRHAVERHIRDASNQNWIRAGAGYWKDRPDIGDAVEYQRAMREDREIDPRTE